MEDLKICPFKQTRTLCQRADCALFIRGCCVLVDIANSLVDIAMDVAALDQGGN